MDCRSSPPRSSSRSLSRPERSAKISAPPSSGVTSAASGRTVTFKSSFAERTVSSRNFRRASAAPARFSWPFSIRLWVIGGRWTFPYLMTKVPPQSGFLVRFSRRRDRVASVQIPLLADAHDAAGQNIDRETARDREDQEHHGERDRHELHHHLLLRIAGGHGRHFGREIHGDSHDERQSVVMIGRRKIPDPAKPGSVAHFDGG